ncbi:hypothetical protein F66182_6179 [Fusarium sp. NRRL 66182]|nr:hypothetical protein F66182_6179 [Fusarium sp. NRRL 66182]
MNHALRRATLGLSPALRASKTSSQTFVRHQIPAFYRCENTPTPFRRALTTSRCFSQDAEGVPERDDLSEKARKRDVHKVTSGASAQTLENDRPWHRLDSPTDPDSKDVDIPDKQEMKKGRLLTTPTRLLKLILPMPFHPEQEHVNRPVNNVDDTGETVEPLALLVHPHQPLSYLERLIQAEIPPLQYKGREKLPDIVFRAEADQEEKHGKKDDSKNNRNGNGNVAKYSGLGHEGPTNKEANWVRWSGSTEIGDFIRDAARGREFAIDIEGFEKELRVAVPSFRDRTYYMRMGLRRMSRDIDSMSKVKNECDKLAHQGAHRLAQGGFAALAGWWGVVYYVTFHTQWGWDLVEPVTYLAGLSTVMGAYLWFLYISRDLSYKAAMKVTVSKRQAALYQERGFDQARWEQLVADANALRKEIKIVASEYDVDWDEKKDLGGEEVKKVLEEEKKGRDGTKVTEGKDDDEGPGSAKETKKKQYGVKYGLIMTYLIVNVWTANQHLGEAPVNSTASSNHCFGVCHDRLVQGQHATGRGNILEPLSASSSDLAGFPSLSSHPGACWLLKTQSRSPAKRTITRRPDTDKAHFNDATMAPQVIRLPDGQTFTVTPVFAGLGFKSHELNTHHNPFPVGWTVVLNTESDATPEDNDADDGEKEDENKGNGVSLDGDGSTKRYVYSFAKPTLQGDNLFISSIANPSSSEFKPAASPTRQIAMMLWITLYWYFHQPEPAPQVLARAAESTPQAAKPRGEWRINIKRDGVLRSRNLIPKLERMGLIASGSTAVGTSLDENGDGWSDMFVSRRMFWQLPGRLFLFSLQPTKAGSTYDSVPGSPISSRPSSPLPNEPPSPFHKTFQRHSPHSSFNRLDHDLPGGPPPTSVSSQPNYPISPFFSSSHLPTYYPPPPLQYIFTNNIRHPLRPKPPRMGEVFYTRFVPSVNQYLSFRVASISPKPVPYFGPVGPKPPEQSHLYSLNDTDLLKTWMNKPRVSAFWGEYDGQFLTRSLNQPNSFPVIGMWDGVPFGYFEIYWVKEDILGKYLGSDAGDWDRGLHVFIGEEWARGRVPIWLTGLIHWCLTSEYRTMSICLEPRVDNKRQVLCLCTAVLLLTLARFLQGLEFTGFSREKQISFPHKQSWLVRLRREQWEGPAL